MDNTFKLFLGTLLVALILIGLGLLIFYFGKTRSELTMTKAIEKFKLGDTEDIKKGIEELNIFIAEFPKSRHVPEALYRIGEGYQKLFEKSGDISKLDIAKEKYRNLLLNYPHSIWTEKAYIRIGNIYSYLGNYDEALAALDNVLMRFPNSALKVNIYNEKGHIYLQTGRYDDAIKAFLQKENMNDDYAMVGRAEAYRLKKETDKAIAIYEEFINFKKTSTYLENVKSDFLNVTYEYANDFLKAKQYDKALFYFKKIISYFPDTKTGEDSFFLIGQSYYEQKKYRDAIEWFKKVRLNKDISKDEDALFNIGICLYEKKDYKQALIEFQSYIDLYPTGKYIEKAKSWKTQSIREIRYKR